MTTLMWFKEQLLKQEEHTCTPIPKHSVHPDTWKKVLEITPKPWRRFVLGVIPQEQHTQLTAQCSDTPPHPLCQHWWLGHAKDTRFPLAYATVAEEIQPYFTLDYTAFQKVTYFIAVSALKNALKQLIDGQRKREWKAALQKGPHATLVGQYLVATDSCPSYPFPVQQLEHSLCDIPNFFHPFGRYVACIAFGQQEKVLTQRWLQNFPVGEQHWYQAVLTRAVDTKKIALARKHFQFILQWLDAHA